MGSVSIPESARALVAHVDNVELAAWMLHQAKLSEPVKLRVTLPGPEAVRHLKGDVNRATTAALACTDPDALDRFARDSRVTIKRVVAGRDGLRPDTIERLWAFAVKNRDAEVANGLFDKIDLEQLHTALRSDDQRGAASWLIGISDSDSCRKLAARVVEQGSWSLFKLAASSTRVTSLFAQALGARTPGTAGLEFSDPASPYNQADSDTQLPLDDLIAAVSHWDRQRARWALTLCETQFGWSGRGNVPPRSGYEVSRYSARYRGTVQVRTEAQVDADAAATLLGVLDRSVDQLAQLERRHSSAGAVVTLLRRELPRAVAADRKQALRHFDKIARASDPAVVHMLAWQAAGPGRSLAPERDTVLSRLSADHDLSSSNEGLAPQLGRTVDDDTLLSLLRSGGLGVTLGWLSGMRFSPPTPKLVAALVQDPGKAFLPLGYSVRLSSGCRWWWTQVPTPSSGRGAENPAASWFLDMLDWHPPAVPDKESADLAYLRQTLSPQLVAAAVDAAGPAGVRSALARPQWLVPRIVSVAGTSLEVWEALIGLAPEWDQSLSELIAMAALVSGASANFDDLVEADTSAAGQLVQLALL